MKERVPIAFILLALLLSNTFAQASLELDRLDGHLTRYFEKTMPDWKHKRVEPIAGSGDNVLIEFWSFSNRKVKVSVLLHASIADAEAVIKNHARYSVPKQTLTGLGDEAYASAYGFSLVAFRKGKFTVYVSTTADVDADADAQSLTQEQRFEREKSQMQHWSKHFAQHVVTAMDTP
jgi:hypothetical protein